MREAVNQAVAFQRELAIEEDREARAAILAAGCEIAALSADQHAQFHQSVAPLLDEARRTYGAEMFEMVAAAKEGPACAEEMGA